MAKYTMELREVIESEYPSLWDFDYKFYSDDETLKEEFQNTFNDVYYFDEIGYETVNRFKQRLKSKLNLIMPYYSQLYYTEVKTKNVDFMLNKSLTETTEREVTKNNDTVLNIDIDNVNNSSSTDNTKVSNIEDGLSKVSLQDDFLTGASGGNSSNSGTSNTKNNTVTNEDETQKEKITFTSIGNIGVDSDADMLRKWRAILININQMIIEECKDLFLKIY